MNQNRLGQFFADAQARIANLANNIGIARQQPDFLLFAKTKFAQAIGEIRGGGKALDADDRAGRDAAQRTKRRAGTIPFKQDI